MSPARMIRKGLGRALEFGLVVPVMIVVDIIVCYALRKRRRLFDVGIGPNGIVNSIYHKKSLEGYGYSVETFARGVSYIATDFDVRTDRMFKWVPKFLRQHVLFLWTAGRYRVVYLYFDGGFLGKTRLFCRLEPWLYRLSKTKTVVMPYGSDVQVLSRTKNLSFVDALVREYPRVRFTQQRVADQIDRWVQGADHIISGCDWVEYMPYWDSLMLSHFAIDTEAVKAIANAAAVEEARRNRKPFIVLHAPNHRLLKGTAFVEAAIDRLQQEGVAIELRIIERAPNAEVLAAIAAADLVVDQLVIGWYAMFALEAMAIGTPVVCYLREDFLSLYKDVGLVKRDEIPLINANTETIYSVLRAAVENRHEMPAIGAESQAFVERHHSLPVIGAVFDSINRRIGVEPAK